MTFLHRTFVALAVCLGICVAASAQSIQVDVQPQVGFIYGGTNVELRVTGAGSPPFFEGDFVDCSTATSCPVRVFFGANEGRVQLASPSYIVVTAPNNAPGAYSITIRRPLGGDIVLQNAFTHAVDARTTPFDYEARIIPVTGENVPGAYGSLWTTELSIHNGSTFVLVPRGQFCASGTNCPDVRVEPGETRTLRVYPGSGGNGTTLYIPKPLAPAVTVALRARNVAGENASWGTEVPVTAERRQVLQLLDVPVNDNFRVTLRAYSDVLAHATVKVLPMTSTVPIDQGSFDLTPAVAFHDGFTHPRQLMIDPITDAVRASGHSRVRIEVIVFHPLLDPPPTDGWAFVTLTNNATQQVTVITPNL